MDEARDGKPICLIPVSFMSAADNILFLFTNARSTQYAPGESGPALRSVIECNRLLERIVSLSPHKVMDTISLNTTKQNVQLLVEPLVETLKTLVTNIVECEKRLSKLPALKGNSQADEYVPKFILNPTQLDEPNMVCTANECCVNKDIPVEMIHDRGEIKRTEADYKELSTKYSHWN
ncbi:unnamed protein product [Oppiella nova]|uniref:Uncharacterized protein n=1 Tax=Oppiella nova TaxID=334625 RepID=A0A7R9M6D1_9ACAR|nr:unnamed protein product [Oppiella nova]CAG2171066.1 unnamed protein product [Oppiella nova]